MGDGLAQGVLYKGRMVDALFSGDNYIMARKLLDVASMRNAAIASNLANVETPGYKRIDVSKDFDVQLRDAVRTKDSAALKALKPTIAEDTTAASIRPDGNNVLMDRELMESNRNAIEFEFLTQYASNSLKRLETSIRGGGSN